MQMLSRRAFAQLGLAMAAGGCATSQAPVANDGRLNARPRVAAAPTTQRGTVDLGAWPRPLTYVPEGLDTSKPAPLVLLLHGAAQPAGEIFGLMTPVAKAHGVVVIAPQARRYSWDVIVSARERGEPVFGEDTQRVDASLAALFRQMTIDPTRVAIAGFSDGGSYALSLGPRNQDLFTHIMAFSPSGLVPSTDPARARVFLAHGRKEGPSFERSANGIVPDFRSRGFDVRFEPFDGGHLFRDVEAGKALDWFLAD